MKKHTEKKILRPSRLLAAASIAALVGCGVVVSTAASPITKPVKKVIGWTVLVGVVVLAASN